MDVMIDLETMGNGPTAAIASIGAVAFEPRGLPLILPDQLDSRYIFHEAVDLQSCQQLGLQIDASTVYFWLRQSDAARQAIGNVSSVYSNPHQVLSRFNRWLGAIKPSCVWAWPPTFDLVILRSAYKVAELKPAWHYTEERCLRTLLYAVTGSAKYPDPTEFPVPESNVAHNALWDAWRQARLVQYCYNKLAGTSDGAN